MKAAYVLLAFGLATMPAFAQDQVASAPPSGAYQKVSELVALPSSCRGSARFT